MSLNDSTYPLSLDVIYISGASGCTHAVFYWLLYLENRSTPSIVHGLINLWNILTYSVGCRLPAISWRQPCIFALTYNHVLLCFSTCIAKASRQAGNKLRVPGEQSACMLSSFQEGGSRSAYFGPFCGLLGRSSRQHHGLSPPICRDCPFPSVEFVFLGQKKQRAREVDSLPVKKWGKRPACIGTWWCSVGARPFFAQRDSVYSEILLLVIWFWWMHSVRDSELCRIHYYFTQ